MPCGLLSYTESYNMSSKQFMTFTLLIQFLIFKNLRVLVSPTIRLRFHKFTVQPQVQPQNCKRNRIKKVSTESRIIFFHQFNLSQSWWYHQCNNQCLYSKLICETSSEFKFSRSEFALFFSARWPRSQSLIHTSRSM